MAGMTTRNEDGTFVKGVSGNPSGRPPGRRAQIDILKQDLEIAVRKNINAVRVTNIIEKMITLAEDGNTKAAKLILDLAVSSAAVQKDATEGPSGITIRIENATFAKQEKAIEAKVVEVKDPNVD